MQGDILKGSDTSSFNLFWLLSYFSIATISAAIITPALPQIQDYFHLSLGAIGWMVSAFLLGYVLGQLVYGPIANSFGRLMALQMGLVLNVFGVALCLLALWGASYGLLMVGRFITGLGTASSLACTFMLINEWLPQAQRKPAMAYAVFSFALGAGVAVFIGGIVTQYWHWQGCFWFLLAHGLFTLWGTKVFTETLEIPSALNIRRIIQDYGRGISSSKLIIYSLTMGSSAVVSYCFAAAGPQIAHDLLKLSAAQYGYWNGMNTAGMIIGGLIAKQLLTRYSVNSVIWAGLCGMAVGIVNLIAFWFLHSHYLLWFFLATASLYLFSSLLFAGGTFVASNALEDKASSASLMSFINMGIATVCVIVMGYIIPNPLLGFIFILTAIWILIASLLSMTK